ncbi:hypothetical protein VSDG_04997 [Cytospora chrysosperma]|uniref:Uncharacterized protein n=1 Tax=Cytospora chrysosperma TaxID=252740 RepID=A0A423VYV0_CYTCH|nr:hypothetical protein VSDG_04997 [Valsa sordida]
MAGLSLKSLCIETVPLLNLNAGESWSETIIGILRNSPLLEYFKLSAGIGGIYNNEIQDLFRNFCLDYEEEGGRPLHLKVLNLGEGMLLVPETWMGFTTPPTYLTLLTKVLFLEELHLYSVRQAKTHLVPLAWGTISPDFTPRLRRLYIDFLDCLGYCYFTMGFKMGLMRGYIRQLEMHVDDVGWFGRYSRPPLPIGKILLSDLDPADLFSCPRRPLETAGLGIGYMAVGTPVVPLLPRPWGHLRQLTASVADWQVSRFGEVCARYALSLEALSVHVRVETLSATEFGLRALVDECTLNVVRRCLHLRYVKFQCCCAYWPREMLYVWKNKSAGDLFMELALEARMGVKLLSPFHYCTDVEDEPEGFWSESRKIRYLADHDLL